MPIRVTFEEQSSRMLLRGNNGQPDVNKESLKLFMFNFKPKNLEIHNFDQKKLWKGYFGTIFYFVLMLS